MGSVLTLGAGLALVLGLMALLVRVLKGMGPGVLGGIRGGPSLAVVSRLPLSPRQGVAVVRFQGRDLLLSYGEGGVRLLREEASEEFGDRLREEMGREGADSLPSPWSRLRRAAGMGGMALLLLALAPGLSPVAAQGAPGGSVPASAQGSAAASASPQAPGGTASVVGQGPGQPLAPDAALLGIMRQLPSMDVRVGDEEDGVTLSGPVGAVLFIGVLTLLPTLILMMTGFTRILVVLHLLKQALGTQTAPPTHLLTAMALLLTGFVMAPTLAEVNRTALTPWMDGEMDEAQMIRTASGPFRTFMLETVREEDLGTFVDMHDAEAPATVEEIPMVVVTAAFVTSELRHAFQIGFALFLPFVVIDVVVASVLMSMGMFMLPPVMVSLPFKLLLFVLVDGWSLVIQGLVRSFA